MGSSNGNGKLVPIMMSLSPIPHTYICYVQKLSYADAPNDVSPGHVVANTQTCTAQNRARAVAGMCMNNEY